MKVGMRVAWVRPAALRVAIAAWLACAPAVGFGAGAMELLDAKTNLDDKASLQSGAKLFVNYCMSCHSVKFMRYNRMGRDLGLTEEQVAENLLFAGEKVVEEMTVAMRTEDAARWFGAPPPDLSVIARARGPDWLYSYLIGFYADPNPARPFGVNNVVFPDVAMPHVLWSLQGVQRYVEGEAPANVELVHPYRIEAAGDGLKIHKTALTTDGDHVHVVDRLELATPGSMQPGEYRKAARDLVNFLTYVGEPAKLVRYTVGFWVLVFLIVFLALTYLLYKEYWKDVH